MMSRHRQLVDEANSAIKAVYSDRSASLQETLGSLIELAGEIAECIFAIEENMEQEEED